MLIFTAYGKDRLGLVTSLTEVVASHEANIIDISQNVLSGIFTIFMVIDEGDSPGGLEADLRQRCGELSLSCELSSSPVFEKKPRKGYVVTLLGRDRPGIMAAISRALSEKGVNIESTKMIARGEVIGTEMEVSLYDQDPEEVEEALREVADGMELDVTLQEDDPFRRSRRLIVFDMDSTLVDAEAIDEMAKKAGVGEDVEEMTRQAMEEGVDFEESLRRRIRRLKGMELGEVEKLASQLELTEGAEDLIAVLKKMGYKIALITGGFQVFADNVRERLGLDYAFANRLEIKNGKLTGEVEGDVIDMEGKASILKEIAEREGIPLESVVAVGDGANDRLMLETAGLGIAFNAKEILKGPAEGTLSRDLRGLLYLIGLSERDVEKLRDR